MTAETITARFDVTGWDPADLPGDDLHEPEGLVGAGRAADRSGAGSG